MDENETVTITIKLPKHDRDVASQKLQEVGLSMSSYVRLAIRQFLVQGRVPFKIVQEDNPNSNDK